MLRTWGNNTEQPKVLTLTTFIEEGTNIFPPCLITSDRPASAECLPTRRPPLWRSVLPHRRTSLAGNWNVLLSLLLVKLALPSSFTHHESLPPDESPYFQDGGGAKSSDPTRCAQRELPPFSHYRCICSADQFSRPTAMGFLPLREIPRGR